MLAETLTVICLAFLIPAVLGFATGKKWGFKGALLGLAYLVSLFLTGLLLSFFISESFGAVITVAAFSYLGLIGALIFATTAFIGAFIRKLKTRARH